MRKFITIAAFLLLFSCSKEEVSPLPPVQEEVKTYTLTVEAGKESTKALSLDESGTLKATWAVGEEVKVYKNMDCLGTLTAQSSGSSTTLRGTITGDISVGTKLSLDFLSSNYTNQDGTLTGNPTSIDKVCDYSTATVKVTSIDGSTVTTESATFSNWQAIVKFSLKYSNNEDLKAREMSLTVSGYIYGAPSSITIQVTPANNTSELYVAIPCYYNEQKPLSFSFDVTNGAGNKYYKVIPSATLENGKYYHITVTLPNNE